MYARVVFTSALLVASAAHSFAQDHLAQAPNAVTDWAAIVQPAIHSPTAPRSAGTSQLLHTIVMLAVYDAVVAIEGGYTPYAAAIPAPQGANVNAAVATAAYLTARARIAASQVVYLDEQYATYLAMVPEGQAKVDGIRVGERASAAVLALRAGDGFDAVVPYYCSNVPPPPGEFEPDAGCPAAPTDPQPVDARVAQVRPFTFTNPGAVRPKGPPALWSSRYTADFIETRDYGRANSTVRTPDQTDIAYFWSEHPYVYWNRNLVALAIERGLSVRDAARFFALVHTATSDAVIAGFDAKYAHTFWRPRTAIPRADADGNPQTDPDPTWTPLLSVNHPEYPSGHSFWSTALTDAVGAFFQTRQIRWTLVASKAAVPQLVKTERTYDTLDAIMSEVENARVWAGLHWRQSMRDGARIGRTVAARVTKHFFQPVSCAGPAKPGPCM